MKSESTASEALEPTQNRETGELLGALTVTGPTRRLHGERFREELPNLLQWASKMVEVNITDSSDAASITAIVM